MPLSYTPSQSRSFSKMFHLIVMSCGFISALTATPPPKRTSSDPQEK
jgi:hypothetical protein